MIELLTNAEMAQADRLAQAAGISGRDLMENAGRAIADEVARRYSPAMPVAVVAGPGNNGGDGYVAARLLSERGYRVRVLRAGAASKGDAAEAAGRWTGMTEDATPAGLAGAGLIIDALFGAGLDRAVTGLAAEMIAAINAGPAPVLAADLPSGINGTTGAVMGIAVKAEATVTFFRRKLGHVLLPGRAHCGAVTVADIGIPESVLAQVAPRSFVNAPPLWQKHLPVPKADGHKYSRGHAVVVSGGISFSGAARLAARGALRAGAGLVTLASPREALAVNAAASLAVMVRPVDGAAELAEFLRDPRRNALVLGPGGGVGPPMRELVGAAFGAGARGVVLDADALTSFAGDSDALAKIVKAAGQAPILTPHEGEFARLFENSDKVVQAESKVAKARLAARKMGAIMLLKGPDSVVAAPDGRAVIAENAPPWLATAGSGDVLSGMIAGLMAQGMPAFEAAAAAVWLHGEAAEAFGPGLISEDLPEMLPRVYRNLLGGGRR